MHGRGFSFGAAYVRFRSMCVRVTSHTRLRARDHNTSSILIGGKGGAGLKVRFTLRLRDVTITWIPT